jgi:hypothetical protein
MDLVRRVVAGGVFLAEDAIVAVCSVNSRRLTAWKNSKLGVDEDVELVWLDVMNEYTAVFGV